MNLYRIIFEHFAGCWLQGSAIIIADSKTSARALLWQKAKQDGTDIRNLKTTELEITVATVLHMECSE